MAPRFANGCGPRSSVVGMTYGSGAPESGDHLELHDLAGVGEVDVVLVAQVLQLDLLAGLVLAEVDQDLVPLGDAVPPGRHARCTFGVMPASVPTT